ncbi:MAG: hypothetical protein IPM98_11245 [Lewinellaceae bacterium]|nr:hypothetical protein [Lewinellaceae bacterium]
MKQISNMRELLDRYWDGETTLEEERMLKVYFSDDDIPEEYRQEARWFRILQSEQAVKSPGARRVPMLSARKFGWYGMVAAAAALLLTAGVWWYTDLLKFTEPPVAARPLHPENDEQVKPPPSVADLAARPEEHQKIAKKPAQKTQKRPLPAVETNIQPALAEDTYADAEQALVEIKAALALVSSKINKSKQTLEKGLQEVDNVEILLKRSM